MNNRTYENPIIGDKVTFIKTSEETNGEYTLIEVELVAGGGNSLHYHHSFSEKFEALEGDLGVQAGIYTMLTSILLWRAARARKNGTEQELLEKYCK